MNKITIDNLTFTYSKNPILKNVSLTIDKSSFALLIGPTGCGKSTLLKIIAKLYPKYGGKLVSGSINLNNLSTAMMFQDPSEQFTMTTPRQEIIFALENTGVSSKYPERLKKAIEYTRIEPLLDRKIINLSGGEKQRVALAVLVAMDVDIFLLDEPFASVDPQARKFLINQLKKLHQQGKTIIITDHVLSDYAGIVSDVFQFDTQKNISKLSPLQMLQLFDESNKNIALHFKLPKLNQDSNFIFKNTVITQGVPLIKQKELNIYKGKIILLTGKNGTGKSTLFKVLTKMLPYSGNIKYLNHEIKHRFHFSYLQKVAQIFQNANDQFLMITVQEEIALSKKHRKNSYFTDKKIAETLKLLKLDTHLNQVVYTLSGGQKKKLQILLMLISGHETLLIDEPLSGLDEQSSKLILQLIKDTQKQMHQTIIMISHQFDYLENFCDYHLNLSHHSLKYTEDINYES